MTTQIKKRILLFCYLFIVILVYPLFTYLLRTYLDMSLPDISNDYLTFLMNILSGPIIIILGICLITLLKERKAGAILILLGASIIVYLVADVLNTYP